MMAMLRIARLVLDMVVVYSKTGGTPKLLGGEAKTAAEQAPRQVRMH
jgi:hypothetical protein